ncbi:uncharacterized protein [Rutidosis leptorrhynchoides]|uniref:uncharacterized protein n=1 Tax=Rutidosis leptorrhynchoides TaxID=125765 RepID=UPI003A9965C2
MSDDSYVSSASITKISSLEFNNPLYLHPSDTSGASLITQKLKGTENYNFLKLMQFLMGLDDVYVPIRSQILTSDPVPTVKTAFSIISTGSHIECILHQCFELIGYPPGYIKKPFNQGAHRINSNNCISDKHDTSATNVQLTSEQIMKLLSFVNEKPAYSQMESNMSGWIIDSAANQHMVSNSQNLNNIIDVTDLNLTVNHPNGTVAKILQMGNLKLSDTIELYDVLDLIHQRLMGSGSKFDGLYFFDETLHGKMFKCNMIYTNLSKHKLWHERLGHPANQALNELSDKLGFSKVNDNTEPCDTCHKFGKIIKSIRSDNGTEFLNNKMIEFIKNKGIIHQTSCTYTPQQNGIAERKHRLLSSVLNGKCPYELIYGKCPNLSHLRTFGCLCFATVLNNHDKFSSRALKCVFLGYSNFQKGYKLFCLDDKSFVFSRDVKFYENIFPFKLDSIFKTGFTEDNVNYQNFFDCYDEFTDISKQNTFTDNLESTDFVSPNDEGRDSTKDDGNHTLLIGSSESSSNGVPATSNDDGIETQTVSEGNQNDNINNFFPQLRRSSRQTKTPSKFKDFILNHNVKYSLNNYLNYSKLGSENYCFVTSLNKGHEPNSFI